MKTIKRTFKALTVLLTIILIHFGLMYRTQKELKSIEYDFGIIF